MGRAVVHFEVMGKDAARLQSFYSDLFDWQINTENMAGYGTVEREGNVNADGAGIGGGIGAMEGAAPHVTFYVEVPDVEEALVKAERLGGTRMMGPDQVTEGVEIGLFLDPDGQMVGVVKEAS